MVCRVGGSADRRAIYKHSASHGDEAEIPSIYSETAVSWSHTLVSRFQWRPTRGGLVCRRTVDRHFPAIAIFLRLAFSPRKYHDRDLRTITQPRRKVYRGKNGDVQYSSRVSQSFCS